MKSRLLSLLLVGVALTVSNNAWSSFTVDPQATIIAWKGSKKLGDTHTGKISVKEGKIETNAKGEVTGGKIVIDMTTISNDDLKAKPSYQKKLIGHLSSPDFFNVGKHPTATFAITGSDKNSSGQTTLKGTLTLIGVTQPVEVPATVQMSKDGLSGEATIKIDRTRWGLKYGSGNIFKELTADKIINDEIEITVKLAAKK